MDATDAEKAIEDIGPYGPMPNLAGAVNTNAHYWTSSVGIAWDRDVDIDLVGEPVDLDGDGKPDTKVTRHVHAKGGVLANPELFGLTATPTNPRGHVGRISVSRTACSGCARRSAGRAAGSSWNGNDVLAMPRRGRWGHR